MKVLDLRCAHDHSFEGWFGSEDDFQSQLSRDLVSCPICGDTTISKMLSAPRLNLSHGASASRVTDVAVKTETHTATGTAVASPTSNDMQAAWLKMVGHVMKNTEDVGDRFVEEARRMHYGETEERGIRGQASAEETRELVEEGIAVLPLPIPDSMKGPIQ